MLRPEGLVVELVGAQAARASMAEKARVLDSISKARKIGKEGL